MNYCSKACQIQDWRVHKNECKSPSRVLPTPGSVPSSRNTSSQSDHPVPTYVREKDLLKELPSWEEVELMNARIIVELMQEKGFKAKMKEHVMGTVLFHLELVHFPKDVDVARAREYLTDQYQNYMVYPTHELSFYDPRVEDNRDRILGRYFRLGTVKTWKQVADYLRSSEPGTVLDREHSSVYDFSNQLNFSNQSNRKGKLLFLFMVTINAPITPLFEEK